MPNINSATCISYSSYGFPFIISKDFAEKTYSSIHSSHGLGWVLRRSR